MARNGFTLSRRWAAAALSMAAAAVLLGAPPGYVLSGAPLGDDASSHFAEISFVADLLRDGQTDFWFDGTNLGYPLFLAYQPAPSLLMGALSAITGSFAARLALFKLSILLLWAAMPVAWYLGGRWLGMARVPALLLGLLALSVSDFRSFGLGISSTTGMGLYTQIHGMLLLPLTLGSFYRYLFVRDVGIGRPTLLLALSFVSHAFFGMYAGIAAGLMALVEPRRAPERLARVATVSLLAGAFIGWWLAPFVWNLEYQGGLPWRGASENGYPLVDVLRWTADGSLFDHGRLPWLTLLVLVGLALALSRWRNPQVRWTLVLTVVSYALLLGRTTWGAAYTLLPFHGELEVIRYLSGIHFCGLVLAAQAGGWLLGLLDRWLTSQSGPAWLTPRRTSAALLIAVVAGHAVGTGVTARSRFATIDLDELALPELSRELSRGRGSRFLCHEQLGTASHVYLNLLPAMAERPQLESFSRGYHDTLSLYYLEYFDFSESSFRLYNVGAALARGDAAVEHPPFMRKVFTSGRFAIFEAPGRGGYFEFVRTPLTIVGSTHGVRDAVRLATPALYQAGVLPRLERSGSGRDRLVPGRGARADLWLDGEPVAAGERLVRLVPRLVERYAGRAIRSRILDESSAPNTYRARVESAAEGERLALKVSFHPYWTATIDGAPAAVDHLGPNFLAVDVPPGTHEVEFRYRNPGWQKLAFLASLIGAAAWVVAARRRTAARRGARQASPAG